MKKFKKNLWSEKVPFGYEKKPVFENFPFHTLGYENFGCFFLMGLNVNILSSPIVAPTISAEIDIPKRQ
jgi:hypothetical protein